MKTKSLIVTGASGYLGTSFIEEVGSRFSQILSIDTSVSRARFPNEHIVEADASDPDSVDIFLENFNPEPAERVFLVNFAGYITSSPFLSGISHRTLRFDLASWKLALEANLLPSIVFTSKVLEKALRNGSYLSVVQVSSINASGVSGQSSYAAGKSALEAATRSIAFELGPLGMRLNTIRLGYVDAPSTRGAVSPSRLQEIERRVSTRTLGSPVAVNSMILSMLENNFLNASTVTLDGGYS